MINTVGLEHPDILAIRNTGYPSDYREPEPERCQECGIELDDNEIYVDENHKCLCKECLCFFHKRDW